jgi:hypothetical protein
MLLEETTRVRAPPEHIYRFFETMDVNYKRWHPDHIEFRWIVGDGLEQGGKAYFAERIAGKTQAKTVQFTEVVLNRYIEFTPTSRLVRLFMPSIGFSIEPSDGGCDFTQRIEIRTGPIGARLNRHEFDAVRTHMKEEGVNLKTILEPKIISKR